jgi:diguanylate cyclase (GGDEF)-like protein/PAS domain S-box-containing protein
VRSGGELSDRELLAVLDQWDELVLVLDANHHVRWASLAFERALGRSRATLLGADVRPLFHPEDLQSVNSLIERACVIGGASEPVGIRIRAVDDAWHEAQVSGANLLGEPGVRGCVVKLRNLSGHPADAGENVSAVPSFDHPLDRERDMLYLAETDGYFVMVNSVAEAITGYSSEELLTMSFLELVVPESVEFAREMFGQRLSGGPDEPFEIELVAKNGQRVFGEVTAVVVASEGAPPRLDGRVHDVTERHLLETRLRHQALHDSLTGLPNRALLSDRIAQALARGERNHAGVAVLLLDVDDFKIVNDTLGHAAGDALLVELAHRVQALLRESETIARLGGDEFAVVAEGVNSERGLTIVSERVLTAFSKPFALSGSKRHLTGSVGVALAEPGSDAESLLRDADTAMYRAKTGGGGAIQLFGAELRQELLHTFELSRALGDVLRHDGLEVHYQPIVNLAGGNLLALEALVRWPDDHGGFHDTESFVHVAEETGLINPLGRFVLTQAAEQAAAWRKLRPDAVPLGVFVNVSPRELSERHFVRFLTETLNARGLSAADIALELTERAFIEDTNKVLIANLEELTTAGVRLVLDDFGTKYSALQSLKRFPLAALKLDRVFIGAIAAPGDEAPVTTAVVGLGRALGLTVIAEGVETALQLDYLRALDCDAVQGYLLGRPVRASELEPLLAATAAPAADSGETPPYVNGNDHRPGNGATPT